MFLSRIIGKTADNIDAQNPNYTERLGHGRLNMFQALTDTESPAVRFTDAIFTDGNDDILSPGDTVRLSGNFINYLEAVSNLNIAISISDPNITVLDTIFSVGSLQTLDTINNGSLPFSFIIGQNIVLDREVFIRIGFQAPNYDDWQWVSTIVNRSSIDIDNGVLATTVNSVGRIGYDKTWGEGLGLQYQQGSEVNGTFGLMLGSSSFRVSDAALYSWNNANPFSNDFESVESIRFRQPELADIELTALFNDSDLHPAVQLGLSVRQDVYAWIGDHFIIAEYEVTNNSNNTYNDFHIGLWGETDVDFFGENRAEQDADLNLGYVYNPSKAGPYIGLQLLGDSPYNLYVYENSESTDGIDITDNFSTEEKYQTLTESRPFGGFENENGDDVGLVVSSGPYELLPGQTITVRFAILVADSLDALRVGAEEARVRWTTIDVPVVEKEQSVSFYPNPAYTNLQIQLPESLTNPMDIHVFDTRGRRVLQQTFIPGQEIQVANLPAGFYIAKLTDGKQVYTGKFIRQWL